MGFVKQKYLLIIALLGILSVPLVLRGEDAPGSRLYWLLNPKKHIEKNQQGKAMLEECISRLGFVQSARILPKDRKNIIEIDVLNVSTIPIAGLIVQPLDERLERLGLDSRTRIDFDPIFPSEGATYTEVVDGFTTKFPSETSVAIVAWDVINVEGVEIVEHILWSHWPLVSSDEEFALAEQEFCRLEGT